MKRIDRILTAGTTVFNRVKNWGGRVFSLSDYDGDYRAPWGQYWYTNFPGEFSNGAQNDYNVDPLIAMAMSIPAANLAVTLHANSLCRLLRCVEKVNIDGTRELMEDSSVLKLLDNPHPRFSSWDWFSYMHRNLKTAGNAYAHIITERGEIKMLEPLNPALVQVKISRTGERIYIVKSGPGNATEKVLAEDQVFHVMGESDNGIVGYHVIQRNIETFEIAVQQRKISRHFLENVSTPSGILNLKTRARDNDDRVKRDQEINRIASGRNSGRIIVTQGDMEYIQLNQGDSTKIQLVEGKKHSIDEIARIFGIPPHMLFELSRSTFNNIAEQSLGYTINTVAPEADRWSSAINRQLMPREILDKGWRFKILWKGAVSVPESVLRSSLAQGLNAGYLTPADARRMLDLSPDPALEELYLAKLASFSRGAVDGVEALSAEDSKAQQGEQVSNDGQDFSTSGE